ncbi:TcpQ domain-containing protein [Escherichia coli]|uniref:TcpQ domain-containing protein n=1 Tax=Escherichia coli TaxID=562 RepID=UPI0019D01475|nr:TcpQ domain-containing protein [Escherichia coli]MBN6416931.1 TcpQ domain-containing protein [Escherichia coli]
MLKLFFVVFMLFSIGTSFAGSLSEKIINERVTSNSNMLSQQYNKMLLRGGANDAGWQYNNKTWQVDKGDTLFSVVSRWAKVAGWQLIWDVKNTYCFLNSSVFYGDFVDSMKALFESPGINSISPKLYVVFYTENNVVHISTASPSK